MHTPHDPPARDDALKAAVRSHYARAAQEVASGTRTGCCGGSCGGAPDDPISGGLYTDAETAGLPENALLASLGCGNPAALAELRPGETVLDLGAGGGLDVLLSAQRVGPSGMTYGLDMTDEMLALARENQRKAGVANAKFLRGDIEAIPLPDASVDVIISNCVINLTADKRKVIAEAFRVLRPGGRLAVSDVVLRGDMPDAVRSSMALWVGCVAGALHETELRAWLGDTGFEQIDIEPTRVYRLDDARAFLATAGLETEVLAREIGGCVMGAFIRARKPASAA
ncbi:MAG: arsenite methyltransferase [Gemmatimonadales bacterium]